MEPEEEPNVAAVREVCEEVRAYRAGALRALVAPASFPAGEEKSMVAVVPALCVWRGTRALNEGIRWTRWPSEIHSNSKDSVIIKALIWNELFLTFT